MMKSSVTRTIAKLALPVPVTLLLGLLLPGTTLMSQGCGGCHTELAFMGSSSSPGAECITVEMSQSAWRPACDSNRLEIINGCQEDLVIQESTAGLEALGTVRAGSSEEGSFTVLPGASFSGRLGNTDVTVTLNIVDISD